MPVNHSNTIRVITILIHAAESRFENVFVTLLRPVVKDVTSSLLSWHKWYDFNAANFRRHSKWNGNELGCTFMIARDRRLNIFDDLREWMTFNKGMSVDFFLGPWGMNRSKGQTSREPRSGSRTICLFRAPIHYSPWTKTKRHSILSFTMFPTRTFPAILW